MKRKLVIDKTKPNSRKEHIACGTLYINIVCDDNGYVRFFFNVNKGGCEANLRAVAALLTRLYNDKRISNEEIIADLEDIICKATMRWKGELKAEGKKEELGFYGNSCPSTIARVLKELEIKEDKK